MYGLFNADKNQLEMYYKGKLKSQDLFYLFNETIFGYITYN